MSKPKIRHLAIMSRNPDKLAKFYEEVFEMEVVDRAEGQHGIPAVFMTDGYLSLAILPCALQGESAAGINHFGFHVDDMDKTAQLMMDQQVEDPKMRPSNRPFAEYRGADPEGNLFDLSVHGYEKVEYRAEREGKKKEPV
ncbi:MAG: VOC family protein [Rhodospirillales bacterium]|nr:VOC family protein [Rhodospirillales bacterium]